MHGPMEQLHSRGDVLQPNGSGLLPAEPVVLPVSVLLSRHGGACLGLPHSAAPAATAPTAAALAAAALAAAAVTAATTSNQLVESN